MATMVGMRIPELADHNYATMPNISEPCDVTQTDVLREFESYAGDHTSNVCSANDTTVSQLTKIISDKDTSTTSESIEAIHGRVTETRLEKCTTASNEPDTTPNPMLKLFQTSDVKRTTASKATGLTKVPRPYQARQAPGVSLQTAADWHRTTETNITDTSEENKPTAVSRLSNTSEKKHIVVLKVSKPCGTNKSTTELRNSERGERKTPPLSSVSEMNEMKPPVALKVPQPYEATQINTQSDPKSGEKKKPTEQPKISERHETKAVTVTRTHETSDKRHIICVKVSKPRAQNQTAVLGVTKSRDEKHTLSSTSETIKKKRIIVLRVSKPGDSPTKALTQPQTSPTKHITILRAPSTTAGKDGTVSSKGTRDKKYTPVSKLSAKYYDKDTKVVRLSRATGDKDTPVSTPSNNSNVVSTCIKDEPCDDKALIISQIHATTNSMSPTNTKDGIFRKTHANEDDSFGNNSLRNTCITNDEKFVNVSDTTDESLGAMLRMCETEDDISTLLMMARQSRDLDSTESRTRHPTRPRLTGPPTCPLCGKTFTSRHGLCSHMRIHTGERPYTCGLCDKEFVHQSSLTAHMRIHTGERQHTCSECNKSFQHAHHLMSHLIIHTGERAYICDICQKAFKHAHHLTKHVRIHTGDKPFPCLICGISFTSSENLTRHMRHHTGDLPNVCSICDNAYATKENLVRHLQVHTGERPYKCQVCGKTFTRLFHLTRHSVIHTGDLQHGCDECDKRFRSNHDLLKHSRTHRKTRRTDLPYVCGICQKGFAQKGNLKTHLSIHTAELPFHCDTCGSSFAHKLNLTAHVLSHVE